MDLFTFENFASLGVLIFLQAVLGFDNLLYISIESQRAPASSRASVRRWGIIIALVLRVVLLFLIMQLLEIFATPWFEIHLDGVIEGAFTFSTIVFLLGGGFLMYTAVNAGLWAPPHRRTSSRIPRPFGRSPSRSPMRF